MAQRGKTQVQRKANYPTDDPEFRRWQQAVLVVLMAQVHEQGLTWEQAVARNVEGWVVTRGGQPYTIRLDEDALRATYDSASAMAAELPRGERQETAMASGGNLTAATRRSPDSVLARPRTEDELVATLRHYRHRVEDVQANTINTRPGYQRLLSERWAAEIARDFNGFLMRPILCARRQDGSLWCIDGQHRLRAFCFYLGRGEEFIEADVYEGLSYADETLLCESFVHAKPAGVLDYLRLKYERNDPDAVALVAAVRSVGLDVAFEKAGRGKVASAGALVAVYEAGGGEHLAETLNLLGDCFGDQPKVFVQPHVLGMHGFLVRYGEHQAYQRASLVEKAAKLGLGAVMQKQAVLVPTISGGNRATAFGKALQTIYNAGRRSNFLPEWQEGVLTQRQRERREAIGKLVGQEYGFVPAGRTNGRKVHLAVMEEDHA